MPVTRGKDGRFISQPSTWSLQNFNEGRISNKGRFMIKLPNHPRAYKSGWMLRAIAAYELYHNVSVKKTDRIHHINGDKLDDSKENLQHLTHGQHQKTHFRQHGTYIKCTCEHCGKEFEVTRGRLKDKSKGIKQRGRFCSQKCYHVFPKPENFKDNHSKIMKKVWNERNEKTKKEISRKLKQAWKRRKMKAGLAS